MRTNRGIEYVSVLMKGRNINKLLPLEASEVLRGYDRNRLLVMMVMVCDDVKNVFATIAHKLELKLFRRIYGLDKPK
jgi:hypothetical protein